MQIYQKSHVFPLGGQTVNKHTVSLGSNVHYLLVIQNLQTADECQEASDVTTGGIKSGRETLCLSLEMLHWHSAFVHLCLFENARTDDSKAK